MYRLTDRRKEKAMPILKEYNRHLKERGRIDCGGFEQKLRQCWDVGYQELKDIIKDLAQIDEFRHLATYYMEHSNATGPVSEFQQPLAEQYGTEHYDRSDSDGAKQKYWEDFQSSQTPRITSITIEHFKGISKPVTVPLRPITLLFGKNSAGKSTILQAMLYALEVIRTGKADIDTVHLGGDAINLGGFRNLVHKHELSRTIRLRFDMQLDDDGLEPFPQFRFEFEKDKDLFIAVQPSIDQYGQVKNTWIELSVSLLNDRPSVTSYTVGLNDAPAITVTNTWDGAYGRPTILNPNWGHPLLRALAEEWEGVEQFYAEPDPVRQVDNPTADDMVWHVELEQESCIPDGAVAIALYDDFEDNDARLLNMLWGVFSQLLVRPIEMLEDHLAGTRYIGPIREIPERDHRSPISMDESRWASGLAAWDALYSANAPESEESDELIDSVNDYIRNVLGLGYELCREDIIEVDVNGAAMNTLRRAALQFEDIDELLLRKAVLDGLGTLPVKARLTLRDLENDVEVAPSDIGVGISQVIPIIVGALAKSANGDLPSILSIEQPELHVHPAVQCALGDLFIREKSDSRVFLIETHSEHLILRFLRRISETTDNELKDPTLALRPKEIGVAYVNTIDGELTLTELPVDEDGEFTVRWPEGFFEERATELFGESEDA